MRFTGLRVQVLSTYRLVLRAARSKPQEQQDAIKQLARQEFEKYRHVDPKDLQLVEHLLRKARKQIELLGTADLAGIRTH